MIENHGGVGSAPTGEELLEAEGIDRVDSLRVDAEGTDLAVLRGSSRALAVRRRTGQPVSAQVGCCDPPRWDPNLASGASG